MSDEPKTTRPDQADPPEGQSPSEASSPPAQADNPSGGPLDQAAIEALLAQSSSAKPDHTQSAATTNAEGLLDQAEDGLAAMEDATAELPDGLKPFEFRNLTGRPGATDAATLELLRDVQLDLRIELGRTHMQLEEVLRLKKGAVVTLDKLAGDPVDVYVNGRLIARGEVLVLNDNFCVRVAELVAGETASP